MTNFKEINYLLFRIVMGINMTIHGAGRLFGDYKSFISRMESMFEPTILPSFLITIGAHLISPLEFIFGILLILGLKSKEAILILTLVMMMLITGVCTVQKWELAGMQMSYVLYLFFLGHFIEQNRYSLDHLIYTRKQ